MRKKRVYQMLFITAFICLASCSDDNNNGGFNPNQPIEITEFYPDSGGIATPMIIEGRNFGTDTTGMKVYFEDVDGIKHPAGLVSTNGNKIYLFVPKGLAFKREMNILVERKASDGQEYIGKAPDQFIYKTQTSVSTVAGLASPHSKQNTVGGDLATCSFSAPCYICTDDEDNIFVIERGLSGWDNNPNVTPYDEKGGKVQGNISMISQTNNSSIVLKYGTQKINAPSFSNEKDFNNVYVPDDAGLKYYEMPKLLSYFPRYRTVLKSEDLSDVDSNNWKFCFVVNKLDHMIYTVMHKGQLVRINPKNRTAEILLEKVSNVAGGSDSYVAFSPIKGQENMLYISLANFHQIWRVDVSKITPEDKASYPGEPYAGKGIYEGGTNGKGWEDGLLKNAKFIYPRQICFTNDGKLYIADSGNSCIRMIDTTIPKEKATVSTPIGLPGTTGYQDGGPEIAKFHYPCGVAVSNDGSIVYVADTQNKVIRKLSIE